jgi:hypothetical protein
MSSKEPVFILSKEFDNNIKSAIARPKLNNNNFSKCDKLTIDLIPFDTRQGQ